MVIKQIRAIAAAKARIAQLERSISRELSRELAGLPAKFGYGGVEAFLGAVKEAARGKRGPRGGRGARAGAPARRRRRAKITEAIRAKVKKLLKSGKTGAEAAVAAGISLPSVWNIKKAVGLAKGRDKAAGKPRAPRPAAKHRAARKARKKLVAAKPSPVADAKPMPAPAAPA